MDEEDIEEFVEELLDCVEDSPEVISALVDEAINVINTLLGGDDA